MKWERAALFALALAGCADSGSFRPRKIDRLCAADRAGLATNKAVRPKALTAKAEASKPNAAKEASLLECVSDACKAQCSLRIEKQSRPKWCLYFKEPIDRPAASAPPEQPKLGSS